MIIKIIFIYGTISILKKEMDRGANFEYDGRIKF